MGCTASELRSKEVINVTGCRRLGNVFDFEIDPCDGRITALLVPSECGIFGIPRGTPLRIAWCNIRCIGDDIILVDLPREILDKCESDDKKPNGKKGMFF